MDEYIYSQPVHKDFHGVISYLMGYLRENYGKEHMENFFKEMAAYIYKPLIERVKKNGLKEMEKHLRRTFTNEDGNFNLDHEDGKLIFNVKKCPAIAQMKNKNFKIDKDFCKVSTDIINRTIARECDYSFSVEYDQENGKCIQKFWKGEK